MSIDTLLSCLDKVKGTNGKYQACCPSHDDKSPSLSITETSNGTVLIRCFAGCSVDEITCALGLEVKDLFPESNLTPAEKNQYRKRKERAALDEALHQELVVLEQFLVIRIAGRNQAKNSVFRAQRPEWRPPPDATWEREELAVKRIGTALEEIYGR